MTSGFSKYDRIETTQSIYCYPDTDVLKNKAGITDSKTLTQYEADVTAMRQYMLEKNPIKGRFGITHLRNIHKHIFQDVYPFAGKLRLEDIWKEDTFFCKSQFLEPNLKSLLAKLAAENHLRKLGLEVFIKRAAYYMSELNMIHPFREGNGRTIREFIRCMALDNGFDIDWSRIDGQELLKAMIIAVDNSLEPLEKCLYKVIVNE
ncbi:Fic/DOC family protein [Hydrogenispora ethanolica]|nr:Fic family protein [Hydrogenispora ethanolica]